MGFIILMKTSDCINSDRDSFGNIIINLIQEKHLDVNNFERIITPFPKRRHIVFIKTIVSFDFKFCNFTDPDFSDQ